MRINYHDRWTINRPFPLREREYIIFHLDGGVLGHSFGGLVAADSKSCDLQLLLTPASAIKFLKNHPPSPGPRPCKKLTSER